MTLRLFLSRYSPGSGVSWWVALSDQSDYSWGPHVFLGSHSNHSKVHTAELDFLLSFSLSLPLSPFLPFSLRSMGALSILFGQVVRGTSAGARVFEYMALHPSIPLRGGATIPANQIEGRVEFKNVKFAYPTRPEQVTTLHLPSCPSSSLPLPSLLFSSNEVCCPIPQVVLEDFTLELPPGKVTALCGLSGAGAWVII